MHVEDSSLRPCTDHALVVADRYHLGPVLRRSPGCCAHRGYDELLQRTVTVTLLAGRGPLVLPPRSWLDRGPEVAELFDAGDLDDRLFLVTQHPAERTLAETTPPGGLDAAEVRALGAAVADTLIPRHRHGSAHGGLGAGTVAWTPRGASLAEFGLLPWLERSGELPVTPPFPAPERGTGAPHDPAGDVYALGRLLDELAPAHRRGGLRELLAEMTADAPADRPTMEEVARRLSATREPGRTRAALDRHGRSAALVAAACCLVLLGVGFSAFSGSAPTAPGATLSATAAAPARAVPRPAASFPVAPSMAEAVVAAAPDLAAPDLAAPDLAAPDLAAPVPTTRPAPPARTAPTRPAARSGTARSDAGRYDAARSEATRSAMRRDDSAGGDSAGGDSAGDTGDDAPSTPTRPTTTPRPSSGASPDSSSSGAGPTRPGSGHHPVRDAVDRVSSPSDRDGSRSDRPERSDRRDDRDLPRES
ncbi:hypothetical protein [Actinomycetospora atypica]|uniref:Protein kinase domain-containing protein n=1 Tax=Actinomycetospora atypica TaxID=1290095 RepID=A0ABV9YR49_9PSEU